MCACVRVCVCARAYVHVCVHVCERMCMCTGLYVCACVCLYVRVYVCVCVCTQEHVIRHQWKFGVIMKGLLRQCVLVN